MGVAREDVVTGVRCFSFRDYLIFYMPRPDGVEILRVVHGARELDDLFLGGVSGGVDPRLRGD